MPHCIRTIIGILAMALLFSVSHLYTAEAVEGTPQKEWKNSAGVGLILAPAYTGARGYSFLAVPDIRFAYKDLFFANVRDGVGYAAINQDGWRVGPVVTYTFSRREKNGGTVFQLAGSRNNSLQGMGNVPGTFSLGGFAEYSLQNYKLRIQVNEGVTGHEGVSGEAKITYGGTISYNGPPLIYAIGPHVKYGNAVYTNAYWGVTPEQSAHSGLEQYTADGGITAYGFGAFTMLPLTKSVSISFVAGFDRLAPPVTHSPLVRVRGSQNQAMSGLSISYGF